MSILKLVFRKLPKPTGWQPVLPRRIPPRHRPFDFARGRLIGGGYTLGTSAFAILMLYVIHV